VGDERRPSSLRNLGPVMDDWLEQIGVRSADDLRPIGSIEAWERLRFVSGKRVSLIALYALDGALTDTDWRRLAPERKADLRQAARAYEAAR